MFTTASLIVCLTASDKNVLLRQIEHLLSVIEANSVPFFLLANRPSLWDGSWNIYYQQVSARHYAEHSGHLPLSSIFQKGTGELWRQSLLTQNKNEKKKSNTGSGKTSEERRWEANACGRPCLERSSESTYYFGHCPIWCNTACF